MDDKFKIKMTIVICCALLALFSITYNGSYAFFSATVESDEDNISTVKAREFKNIEIKGDTISPKTDMIPGQTAEYTFQVTNDNDKEASYRLVWDAVTNQFERTDDLVMKLDLVSPEESNVFMEKVFPSANNEELRGTTTIAKNTTHKYKLTITYKDDPENNQINDKNKIFKGTIKLAE